MLLDSPEPIRLLTGCEVLAYASFEHGQGHVIVDDGQWLLVVRGRVKAHISAEALAALRELPDDPRDYEPYRREAL